MKLQEKIDFNKLVASEANYDVELDKSVMPRLQEACVSLDSIKLKVKFYKDLQGLRNIEGSISALCTLVCQRCGNNYKEKIETSFKSTPDLKKAESLRIADKLDFIDIDENGIFDLYDYLEDCLLVSLPIVAAHDDDDENCQRQGHDWTYGDIVEDKKENPFDILKDLKGSLKK